MNGMVNRGERKAYTAGQYERSHDGPDLSTFQGGLD
jgi:hypothetical protein